MIEILINLESVLVSGMVASVFFVGSILWIFKTHESFLVK